MKDFFRLLALMRAQWKWLLLGVLCSVMTLLANAALLALAAWFLACMALAGSSQIPFNYHLPASCIRTLAIIRTLGRYVERLVSHQATFKVLSNLRVWFFTCLEPLAPAGLGGLHSGDVFSRIKADIDHLDGFYLRFVLPAVSAVIVLAVVFIFVSFFSLHVAVYMACIWGLAGLVLPWVLRRQGMNRGEERIASLARMRTRAVDMIHGLEELVVLGQSQKMLFSLQQENSRLAQNQAGLSRLEAGSQAGMGLCVGLCVWGVLLLAIFLVHTGGMSGVHLPMLVVLALVSFESLQQLPSALQAWGSIQASAQRLWAVIDQEPMIKEPDLKNPQPETWEIALHKVRFTYPGRELPVFEDLDLEVRDRERVGIIGPTGSGKTSIIYLLLRLYPLDQGDILVGGHSIAGYASEQLRSWIGVIAQNTYLFHASIKENLLLANPRALDVDLYQALETARLDAFVRSLPDKLDTQVGQAGVKLSGGQARRLGIARAVLRNTPVLVLDEPTEGLDLQTEQDLWRTLEPVLAEKTVLLVTHRELGLGCMDRVVSLK